MKIFDYKNDQDSVYIQYENAHIDLRHETLIALLEHLHVVNAIHPIDTVKFQRIGSVYKYELKYQDGRILDNTVTFDIVGDPLLHYNSISDFRRTELLHQLPIRDYIFSIHNIFSFLKFDYKVL